MRPSKFPLSLLPLAGCGLAVSQQRQQSEQSGHSTGVDPVELVGALNGLVSISRNMQQELLQLNKNTAAEMSREDTLALGIGYVKWKKYTSDFLVTLGQSSDIFPKIMPQSAPLEEYLKTFKRAANYFSQKFESVTPNLDRHIGWIELELYVTGKASNLPANFERTIRRFTTRKTN
ncbi:hypothetical protein INS49_004486 [Diaporthe citri]|uniref:uncharacterized protein n=1 Tax=Diaporthe citri TaxID=83186 RepID=UPI001C807870|nr:uncharacterized protein INS49_004486 [Diaporthe citri]KAG6354469.1 hypothetical protein INS49_004486 [Diaporthe citri]